MVFGAFDRVARGRVWVGFGGAELVGGGGILLKRRGIWSYAVVRRARACTMGRLSRNSVHSCKP